MARLERQRTPSLEQMQQAYAQRRLVMQTPQIPPFDQGNLSTLTDFLERSASLQNRRHKAKLAGDSDRMAEIRASQKKLAQSEAARLLRHFEVVRWRRVLLGAMAQGVVISLVVSLIWLGITRHWSWSPLAFISLPIIWGIIMWNLAPPVWSGSGSPKRARKLARALGRRVQTAGVYALVARPWLTAYVLAKLPGEYWRSRKSRKASRK